VGAPIQLEEKYMQKKLIALAVAGLVSAPAFAQSNVTIYGSIDYGYTVQNKNVEKGVRSRQGLDSSVSKANRIGFKGTEDLGNGLKAVFVLETGLNGDAGSMFKDNNRQSFAGLAGGFGTVAFGRQYTPQHLFTGVVDPFGNNGIGAGGNALVKDKRLDNLVAYISPTWGGFSFVTGYTNSYSGNESNENKVDGQFGTHNTRVLAFAPSYTNGGLFVGLNYHQAKFNDSNPTFDIEHLRVYEGYAAYDFGPVKLGALYGHRTTSIGLDGVDDIKLRQFLVGATWKITSNDALLVSYSNRRVEVDDAVGHDSRLGQWAIGYDHNLSKRTAVYARYARQYQNRAQRELPEDNGLFGVAGYAGASVSGDADFGGSGYRQGFAVGIRHDF
jgi:predicted porin